MDEFSYLSVLISIVLGLALTQLIMGAGRLIQARARVDMYWPSLVWVGVLIVIDVQTWWAMFGLRDFHAWNFFAFLLVLAHSLALCLLASLALPDAADLTAAKIALKDNYYAHSRWFFGAIMFAIGASLARPLAFGGAWSTLDVAMQAGWFASAAAAALTRNETYHRALAVIFPITLALYIGALFGRL